MTKLLFCLGCALFSTITAWGSGFAPYSSYSSYSAYSSYEPSLAACVENPNWTMC